MRIEHYKRTPIARAPDEIIKATNEYTQHKAVLNQDNRPHIYHFHNKIKPDLQYSPNQIIHYHSEPERVDLNFPGTKLTLAQYHCTLPEYQDCKVVRNIIPIYDDLYKPSGIKPNKLIVGYSPSHTHTHIKGWFDKGLEATRTIFKKIKASFPDKFDYDIITGVKPDECMIRKNKCNVIIDECVTGSYHKCTLEGLAMGKLTICSLSKDVQDILFNYAPTLTIHNIQIQNLADYLVHLLDDLDFVHSIGDMSRDWMELYWRPQDIIKEYIDIYEEVYYGIS